MPIDSRNSWPNQHELGHCFCRRHDHQPDVLILYKEPQPDMHSLQCCKCKLWVTCVIPVEGPTTYHETVVEVDSPGPCGSGKIYGRELETVCQFGRRRED